MNRDVNNGTGGTAPGGEAGLAGMAQEGGVSEPENPQAFPQQCADAFDVGMVHEGMTLRDWFATHAPPVAWNFEPPSYQNPSEIIDWSNEAQAIRNRQEMERDVAREVKWRFYFADAMLAERAKATGEQP